MNCFRPYPARVKQRDGGYKFYGFVSCGSCLACKIQKSSEWAMRLTHEYSIRKKGVFLTLTYNDKFLPSDGNLNKEHLQKFHKRLRQKLIYILIEKNRHFHSTWSEGELREHYSKVLSGKMKYFSCGEYGDEKGRPHYHDIILGFSKYDKDFVDAVKSSWTYCDWDKLEFDKTFGSVTYDSCRYVADYSFSKKSTNELVRDGYLNKIETKDDFGNTKFEYEVVKQPPFQLISQGIGKSFVDKYRDELITNESVRVHGAVRNLPRYYREKLGLPKTISSLRIDRAKLDKYNEFIKLHRSEFDDYCIKTPLLRPLGDENNDFFDYMRKESFYEWFLFKTRKQAELNQYSSTAIHKKRQRL